METQKSAQPKTDGSKLTKKNVVNQSGTMSSAKPTKNTVNKPSVTGKPSTTTRGSASVTKEIVVSASKTATKTKSASTKKATDDTDKRLARLEKLVLQQAEDNENFRSTFLAAVTAMGNDDTPNHDDHDDGNGLSTMPTINDDPEHNVSDGQSDDGSVSLLKVNDTTQSTETEGAQTPSDKVDKGFAAQFAGDSEFGEDIRGDVAIALNYAMVTKLDDKSIQDLNGEYKCPENCETLEVPKVNPPIWDNLPSGTRSRDLKLQRIQRPLVKGLIAMAKDCTDPCSTEKEHGFMLLSTAYFELNQLRRDFIKPDLNPRFAHLCKPSNKVTKLLFGDDLGQKIKDIQNEQKATYGIMKQKKFMNKGRKAPYPTHKQGFVKKLQTAAANWKTHSTPFLGENQEPRFHFKQKMQQQKQQGFTPRGSTPKGNQIQTATKKQN